MLILDNVNRKIEVVLAGAITTNQLDCSASYVDIVPTTPPSFTPGTNEVATNSTTAVTLVAAPAASTYRQLKLINIYNADTVAATVTVRFNDNGTTRILMKVALNSGDTLQFMDSNGWSVISNNGQLKTGFALRQSYTAKPANPAFTASVNPTRVMCGLAGSITPQGSGNILLVVTGQIYNDTTGKGFAAQLRMGTGTAPTNGAAAAGTAYGNEVAIPSQTSNIRLPLGLTAIATGLTVGTTYWIDLAQSVMTGGNGALEDLTIVAFEL